MLTALGIYPIIVNKQKTENKNKINLSKSNNNNNKKYNNSK